MSEDTTQVFLSTYNRLDALLRMRLNADAKMSHAKLIEKLAREDAVVMEVASRLHAFRALRNAIVHMAIDGETEPIAAPHETAVEEYQGIVRLISQPPKALDWMATRESFTASWNTPLFEALGVLEKNGWDTLPIVENNCLEGMYTLASLQSWLLDTGYIALENATLNDMRSRIGFDKDDLSNERFCVRGVRIMAEEATVREVEDLFRAHNQIGQYILVVCFTKTGKWGEPLLGLVTPHNLPSANPEAHSHRVQRSILG